MSREQQEKLIAVFEKLSVEDRAAVANFAEFLLSRTTRAQASVRPQSALSPEVPEPEPIPRPEDEKVVAAVKRLSKTYHMLNKSKMLGVTSDLVTQHIMQGRDAVEVIDELEAVFRDHYQRLKRGGDE